MKKLVIVGGKLQGLEAAYLALKAGIETTLVDRRENPIARPLCHRFMQYDVMEKNTEILTAFMDADLVLPALEDDEALAALQRMSVEYGFVLAFDPKAYAISSSKLLSDRLIHESGIPAPQYYPGCKTPYIVKPSNLSGSHGVRHIGTKDELEAFLSSRPAGEEWIAQEFLTGPSYSIEVIGQPGSYRTYEVTEIHMDPDYDCKRVTAPCDIPDVMRRQFEELAVRLATILELRGIMDVEVIDDGGILKVLEIDARIPSQTPTEVYHCTGVNMVSELFGLFCPEKADTGKKDDVTEGNKDQTGKQAYPQKKPTVFEHFLVDHDRIRVLGERIMGAAGPLRLITGFCGADEALTDYVEGAVSWRGTFINSADSTAALEVKRRRMIAEISKLQGRRLEYLDQGPGKG